jgi:hypothetical protein
LYRNEQLSAIITSRHSAFGDFLSSADLFKPLLDILETLRVIFKISGTFLEQVEHWHTLEHGVPLFMFYRICM